jgi:hypothetical protein
MKLRNLMTIGLMVAGLSTAAQAQTYYGAPGVRGDLARRVAIDRRVVERERVDLRYANRFNVGPEVRGLRASEARLACDRRALRRYPGRW